MLMDSSYRGPMVLVGGGFNIHTIIFYVEKMAFWGMMQSMCSAQKILS